MATPTLPVNPYISLFDFRQEFDLVQGKLKLSLLTQHIQNAAGITGVKLKIITPHKVDIVPQGFIFTAVNYFTTYDVMLPRAMNTFIYGNYTVRLTLVLQGKEYTAEKVFNLCAIEKDEPLRTDGRGKINLTVDCNQRKVVIAGLTGYTYKGVSPAEEDKNITVYYPTESEKSPQKNISVTPHKVEARNGEYVVKGAVHALYSFEDNTFVRIKWIAEAKRKVRCGISINSIYSALDKLYSTSAGVQALCDQWCQIGPLLTMIQLGMQSGRDISEYVERLETLIKIDCGCSDLGDLVEDNVVPICPQVSDASATVNGFNMMLQWSSLGIPSTSHIKIEYRPKGNPNSNWTELTPTIPATGGLQSRSLLLMITGQYEARFFVVSGNTTCDPVTISSNTPASADCVDIIDIIGVSGAGATGGTGGTTQPATTTAVPGSDTIYTLAKATGEMPTASEILAGVPSTQNASGDFLADMRVFNDDYAYLAIAWPNKGTAAYQKNHWVENALDNFGGIGGPENLFGDIIPIVVGGQNYFVTITNYPSKFLSTQNPLTIKKI